MKYANPPAGSPKQATGLKKENHQGNSTSDKTINSYIQPILDFVFIYPDKSVDKKLPFSLCVNTTVSSLFEWSPGREP